jgi:hypothetical protein
LYLLGSFKFLSASAAHQSCLEILKQSFDRDKEAFKNEIFGPGEKLLQSYFSHSNFYKIPKSDQIDFALHAKFEIIQNMIDQGTDIHSIPHSTAFVVLGGKSRIGRIAHNLRRQGINLLIDFETLYFYGIDGFYSPRNKIITLGLEEALFPNQVSYSLLHEATHAFIDQKVLFVPKILSEQNALHSQESHDYAEFTIDEVITYSKQMLQMVNPEISTQTTRRTNAARASGLFSASQFMKDLSVRIVAKKDSLLRIVHFLKQAEDNPSLINTELDTFGLNPNELDPNISLAKSGFLHEEPQKINSKIRATRVVIEEAIRIAELALGI